MLDLNCHFSEVRVQWSTDDDQDDTSAESSRGSGASLLHGGQWNGFEQLSIIKGTIYEVRE